MKNLIIAILLAGAASLCCGRTDSLIEKSAVGDLEGVKKLVSAGADVNCFDTEGITPLIAASKEGHTAVAAFLLEKGAFPHMKYKGGRTALIEAVAFNRPETVKLLLDKGADVNAVTDLEQTPLSIAVTLKRDEIIPLLKAAGAREVRAETPAPEISDEEAYKRAEESRKRFLEASKKNR
ncbi:MAG TPA: ankyrin repeat domain-containing protein [Spirochaetes bacterium]|nr:ankyrin repeat domain-containing protein [Spirochaetota bacterium]